MIENGIVPKQRKTVLQTTKSVCLIATVAITLNGCAHIKPRPLVDTQTSAVPTAPTAPAPNGAIFQSAQPAYYGYQPLF